MNICRIVKIVPDGKPWQSQYGTLYPLYVTFADGTAGTVNSKAETPPYKVGEEVGYEVKGATPRGVPHLKIDRKADPRVCPNTTPQDFHPDLVAASPAQKPPQKDVSAPAQTEPPPDRLDYYTSLYIACLGAARKTCSEASFADDPETVRQIATAYFIQGIREGIKVGGDLPF